MRLRAILLAAIAGVFLSGCNRHIAGGAGFEATTPDPCAFALARHEGGDSVDLEISRLQSEARAAVGQSRSMEMLGWTFVQKARLSYDAGYYKLAEACAACLESRQQSTLEALLLRGHVLHSLHRFKEAEEVARKLVAARGLPFDYGLLGDALMEQGRLTQAIDAYQKMIDMKPGPQSYSRAAHVRWLKGNLAGAIELMRMAARAGTPRDGESAAWAYTRLANYEMQAGAMNEAMQACEAALTFQPDYAPALLARGRLLWEEMNNEEAIESLKRAARFNPLPEYQWALADALRSADRLDEASAIEDDIIRGGATSDPRTFALYLASRREHPESALELAQREIEARADVFTLDALAWSLAAAGRSTEAASRMAQALAEGTVDARLFYHAGMIAAMNGHKNDARRWLGKAASIRQMLLPSEQRQLNEQLSVL